ncbi:hypothetical protein LXL04_005018 [Taraxacum kok-saghyz]
MKLELPTVEEKDYMDMRQIERFRAFETLIRRKLHLDDTKTYPSFELLRYEDSYKQDFSPPRTRAHAQFVINFIHHLLYVVRLAIAAKLSGTSDHEIKNHLHTVKDEHMNRKNRTELDQNRAVNEPNEHERSLVHSRSFENSYIPENPRTPKPLTFSKNRLRGAKNRSNISPVAKKKFRKNDFFFFQKLCICANFFCVHMCTRILMIKNVLEGSEVGFLKGITRQTVPRRRHVGCFHFLGSLPLANFYGGVPKNRKNQPKVEEATGVARPLDFAAGKVCRWSPPYRDLRQRQTKTETKPEPLTPDWFSFGSETNA